MEGRKRKAAGAAAKVDPELDCVICLNLVLNATQSSCCGSTFCRTCIHEWLKANDTCPTCRRDIEEAEDIHPDVRADRKSSQQSRPCKHHEEHGCDFTGTRQEVEDHEPECSNVPSRVLRQDMRKVEKQKSDLEIENADLLTEIVETQTRNQKNTAAIQVRLDRANRYLESMKDFWYLARRTSVLEAFAFRDFRNYNLLYTRVSDGKKFKIRMSIANSNFALYVKPDDIPMDRAQAVHLDFRLCLFHPDGNEKKHRYADFSGMTFTKNHAGGYSPWSELGWDTWMSIKTLKEEYVKNGRFYVGVTYANPHMSLQGHALAVTSRL